MMVVRRHFQRERLSRVWVGHLAAEDARATWIWVPAGSAHRDLGHADGRHLRQVPFEEWPSVPKAYDQRPWSTDVLMMHPREGDFSVWFFRTPSGELTHWYVNLERPAVRWTDGDLTGLDTIDYDLDVVVRPDLSWSWKDNDEFVERLGHPDVYWVDDEQAVRAEGERIIKLAEAGEFPFDGTMLDYRPDPNWTIPTTMPIGWDRPRSW
jgi:protein associated with RNAse G/E